MIQLCYETDLCVVFDILLMLCARFREIPHSMVGWISRNAMLDAGAKSEVEANVTQLKPTAPKFMNKHSI